MKPTSNFRMTSQTKTFLASITDKVERNNFKAAMIQAQLASEQKLEKKS